MLTSTGSAVVWWLARHEDEMEKAVDMVGPLAQITAAANDEEVPELSATCSSRPIGARSGRLWGARLGRRRPGRRMFEREEEVGGLGATDLLLTALGIEAGHGRVTGVVASG